MKKLLLLLLLSLSSAGFAACSPFWIELLYPEYLVVEDAYGECHVVINPNANTSNSYSGSSSNTYKSNSSNAFTLRDVENKCEVWRWSENWGDVDCRGSDLRIVERKCEVWFPNAEDNYGYIECSGSDLRAIENCSVWMWSESYGDIDC